MSITIAKKIVGIASITGAIVLSGGFAATAANNEVLGAADFGNGTLREGGNEVSVPVTWTCEKGQTYRLNLHVEQRPSIGSTVIVGTCTGGVQKESMLVFSVEPFSQGHATGHLGFLFGSQGVHVQKSILID